MAIYLVTGVAGFIAAKVAGQLLAAGHTVVGVDNLNNYYDVRLKLHRLGQLARAGAPESEVKGYGLDGRGGDFSGHLASNSVPLNLKFDRFSFHQLDIENLPALECLFAETHFSAVFNLAARAGVRASIENPEIYRSTNIRGEENVLKCQVKFGVKKHVLASSSSVYAGCPMPFLEDAELGQGQSPYAETKKQAELLARDYHLKHGLDVTVLRYFTVFGPAGRPDMAPFRFIKWIDEGTPITLFGDGTQARDFTYVDDIARGTVLAGQLRGGRRSEVGRQPADLAPGYDVINLGGGNNPLTITAMIEIIESALGKRAKIDRRPVSSADMAATWANISRAGQLLNWKPQISPREGFRRTVEWHTQNREWLAQVKV